jgi:alanyl-tRNA synthetase
MGESVELCGGTHVTNVGDIGYFAIASEESIAAGVRRIEAYTGERAVIFSREKMNRIEEAARLLKCNEIELTGNIKELQTNIRELQKSNEKYKINSLLLRAKESEVNGVKLISLSLSEQKVDLKALYDNLRNNHQNAIIIAINADETSNKIALLIGITKDLAHKYSAKLMIEKCFSIIDGKGGGNQEVAQASGTKLNTESVILETIRDLIGNL